MTKMGKMGKMENFCFYFIGSNVLVLVAQISVSSKSYGCVDGKNAN